MRNTKKIASLLLSAAIASSMMVPPSLTTQGHPDFSLS